MNTLLPPYTKSFPVKENQALIIKRPKKKNLLDVHLRATVELNRKKQGPNSLQPVKVFSRIIRIQSRSFLDSTETVPVEHAICGRITRRAPFATWA